MTRIVSLLGIASLAIIAIGVVLVVAGVISRSLFDLVFAVACVNTAIAFMVKIGVGKIQAVVTAIVLTGSAVTAQMLDPDIALAPYLAIVLINGLVAYIFACGLLPGREPLILQIARLMGSGFDASPGFQHFAYGQCRIWTGLGLLTSLCGLVAMVSPLDRPTAGVAIVGLILVQIAWFILSHLYANQRYGRPETWLDTLRTMSRPAVWAELEI